MGEDTIYATVEPPDQLAGTNRLQQKDANTVNVASIKFGFYHHHLRELSDLQVIDGNDRKLQRSRADSDHARPDTRDCGSPTQRGRLGPNWNSANVYVAREAGRPVE